MVRQRRVLVLGAMLAACLVVTSAASAATPQQRARALVNAMTLDEKVALVSGGPREAIPRLGIPAEAAADGGQGVHTSTQQSTAMPAGINLASSWDPALAERYGDVVGRETWLLGYGQMLGPVVDLARLPTYGRLWEAFGEDPLLLGTVAAGQIRGEQQNDIISMLKHYNLNNQETSRTVINEVVDERTLQEIYTRPWEVLVKEGNPLGALCAFPSVNGEFACGNHHLLTDILKNQLGFKGFVQTDFNAAHSTLDANAGLDIEDPSVVFFGDQLKAAVQSGTVPMSRLDDMVYRYVYALIASGYLDHQPPCVSSGSGYENPGPECQAVPADVLTQDDTVARQVADSGIVLLRNRKSALPLSGDVHSIAVIGSDANFNIAGGGAGNVPHPSRVTTTLQGIQARAGGGVQVTTAPGTDPVSCGDALPGPAPIPSSVLSPTGGTATDHGLSASLWLNSAMAGTPFLSYTDLQVNRLAGLCDLVSTATQAPSWPNPFVYIGQSLSARWTGTFTPPASGRYTLTLTHWGTARLVLDGQTLIARAAPRLRTDEIPVELVGGHAYSLEVDYVTDAPNQTLGNQFTQGGVAKVRLGWRPPAGVQTPNVQQAADVARSADVAIVVARDYNSESIDRANLRLPQDQDRLIEAVAAANPRTIVLLETGGPVEMPWLHQVEGVLESWYAGQEQGSAIADVLFGDVNPSGKLPVTFPRSLRQSPVHTREQAPGPEFQWQGPPVEAHYTEGLFVGYRGYDHFGYRPLFPFGYGLSYTSFDYGNLRLSSASTDGTTPITARFRVTNTGARAGTEVAQVYVGLPASTNEPPKQLAGWARVTLQPGEGQMVTVTIDPNAPGHVLSYWNTAANGWATAPGTYTLYVGTNEQDTPLQATFTVPGS